MKWLTDIIGLLLTPRRSFSYRALESQLQTVTLERDQYRDLWQEAMRYIAFESGKPRFSEAETPPTFSEATQAERTVSPIQEEQDRFATEKNHRFYAWQDEQRKLRAGAANDVEVPPSVN